MPISPELKKLAQQALQIRGSQVPLHRVMDVLAMQDGDISQAINRYHDIKDPDLRRSLHYCALLLRQIEQDAGLKPAWEVSRESNNAKPDANRQSATSSSPAESATPSKKSRSGFSADDLRSFVEGSARGNLSMAKVYVDGASKGNPGESGIGVAMFAMDGRKVAQVSKAIGTATNNIAEYTALIEALHVARDLQVKTLHVISDSELMVNQVSGKYKIKNVDLLKKAQEVMALRKGLDKFTISYVGRENNKLADALSTAQIKKKTGSSSGFKTGSAPDAEVELDDGSTD
jgi:ribonuclease HI